MEIRTGGDQWSDESLGVGHLNTPVFDLARIVNAPRGVEAGGGGDDDDDLLLYLHGCD